MQLDQLGTGAGLVLHSEVWIVKHDIMSIDEWAISESLNSHVVH